MKNKLEIDRICKRYGEGTGNSTVLALDQISVSVRAGEFVSLLGPSGCGKSTLLYMIAGFEKATNGQIRVDGRLVTGPGADRGMVFQDYALFPWRTLLQNVMFGLERGGLPQGQRMETARQYIAMVGLTGFESSYPHQLSGGMRQRCALARSVANNPDILLMDEPLAAIDALTRNTLQEEILKVCAERGAQKRKTVLYVTHAIDEAIFLSDRIVLMTPRPGRLLEIIDVPFGSERNDATRMQPEFQSLMGRIWQTLKIHMTPEVGTIR